MNATPSTVNSTPSTVPAGVEPAHVVEAKAYLAKVEEVAREGNGLGNLALEEIARNMGATCENKFGRPSELGFVAFMVAMNRRNLSIKARSQLADIANKAALAAGPERKPVFKTKAQASSVEGGFSYKLNLPATFETSIG